MAGGRSTLKFISQAYLRGQFSCGNWMASVRGELYERTFNYTAQWASGLETEIVQLSLRLKTVFFPGFNAIQSSHHSRIGG